MENGEHEGEVGRCSAVADLDARQNRMNFKVCRTRVVYEEAEVRARSKAEALDRAKRGDLDIPFDMVDEEFEALCIENVSRHE